MNQNIISSFNNQNQNGQNINNFNGYQNQNLQNINNFNGYQNQNLQKINNLNGEQNQNNNFNNNQQIPNNQQQININQFPNIDSQNPQFQQFNNNNPQIQQNPNCFINNINNNIMNNNLVFNQQNLNFNNQNQFLAQNNMINAMNNQNNFFNNLLMNQNNIQAINNINNTNVPPKTSSSNLTQIKQFTYVPMIGLKNIGQTCYMNSVLQCFSNISHLTNYFLNPSKEAIIKNNLIIMANSKATSLSKAYKELIEKLWKGTPNTPYSPNDFKKTLGELSTLFKDNNAGDAKDLACFIIMQIHTELNNIDSKINKSHKSLGQQDNIIVNPYDRQQVWNYFYNDFALNQNSIMTQTFYGTNQGMFECQVCKMNNMQSGNNISLIKYNYENYFYLEFPLDEVRKFVFMQNNNMGMNMGMNYQNIDQVNIFDCFNYYQKQNEMDGYCEKCGSNNAKIFSFTQIYTPPHILMIILNRGKGLQYKIKINFLEKINLSQIITNNDKYNNNYYELQSVIKHLGESDASGHFIAYCRSPIPNFHDCWFCYNDETVTQTNNWNDIHDIGVTYILFYQLK